MSKNILKVLGLGIMGVTLLTPVVFLQAKDGSDDNSRRLNDFVPREVMMQKMEDRMEDRFDDRDERIEEMRARLASSTATGSAMRLEKLDDRQNKLEERRDMMMERFEERQQKFNELKERLANREFKIIPALENIAERITKRIELLEGRGLDLTEAKSSLASAENKIAEVKAAAEDLKKLLEDNKNASSTDETAEDSIRLEIREAHQKVIDLTKEAHELLRETIKKITEVLPNNN